MTGTLVIRLALPGDVAAIRELLADDALGRAREDMSDEGLVRYRQAFQKISEDARNDLYVVEEAAGRIVATAQVTWIAYLSRAGNERCHVEAVRVAGNRRGKGIGQKLMKHIIGKARARGCLMVQLTSDLTRDDAHRFYDRLGFKTTHHGMKLIL